MSKSRSINSKADLDDLNFVEQESGVGRQHEENMKGVDQQNKMDSKFADALIGNSNEMSSKIWKIVI